MTNYRLKSLVDTFCTFSKVLSNAQQVARWAEEAENANAWFDKAQVMKAIKGIQYYLREEHIKIWLTKNQASLSCINPKRIAVIMAGNIPLVGFHDVFCSLICGNEILLKTSHSDSVLWKHCIALICKINPDLKSKITISQNWISDFQPDAVIATGSNHTYLHFDYYFKDIPKLLRKSRTSATVLSGKETDATLEKLYCDITDYYGLGCRSVKKLYLPKGYNVQNSFLFQKDGKALLQNRKYRNNYQYQKAIYNIEERQYLDTGYILLERSTSLHSPIAVVNYEFYEESNELFEKLENQKEEWQCIYSEGGWFSGSTHIGAAQLPDLFDYADHINTIDFFKDYQTPTSKVVRGILPREGRC